MAEDRPHPADKSISELKTYDLVLDCVGKARSSQLKIASKKSPNKHGKYISIDDGALMLESQRVERIRDFDGINVPKPINEKSFSFESIVEAHHYVEKGHNKGNIAITAKSEIKQGTVLKIKPNKQGHRADIQLHTQ
ncbi:MAG: hypothetical protein K9N29_05550 [Candidatus Marinimicrobia bacterium]|nr:hypothetical protein [Candidatus Neomarinimicrobiota bacterium]